MQGRPGGPASRTGRAAHGRAAGTRPLSSLQLENKQKAGRLLVGTTGRFPWEKLPCSSPRWRCASLHRARAAPERRAAALQSRLGTRRSPGSLPPPDHKRDLSFLLTPYCRLVHQVSRCRNGGGRCTFSEHCITGNQCEKIFHG